MVKRKLLTPQKAPELTSKQRKENLVQDVIKEFVLDVGMECFDPMQTLLMTVSVKNLKEFLIKYKKGDKP